MIVTFMKLLIVLDLADARAAKAAVARRQAFPTAVQAQSDGLAARNHSRWVHRAGRPYSMTLVGLLG